uniref:F-box domain-containing protein n=1 Tax=Tanacetum cinerariifolium TaxID=118510 RepID=A0A699GXA7_TANCI|nr:F-box domain-containing protein [Tanacetum cinerariifolium]
MELRHPTWTTSAFIWPYGPNWDPDVLATERMEKSNRFRPWADLPTDLLSSIANRLEIIELLSFRGTCKDFRRASLDASASIESSARPWILAHYPDPTDGNCFIYKPLRSDPYCIHLPDLKACMFLASYQGWLLVFKPKQCSLFFFSPFSRAKIDLPDFPMNEIQHHASAFSDLPTSPHLAERMEKSNRFRPWADLPTDLLSSIANRLEIIELLSFHGTYKDFRRASLDASASIESSARPCWLLVFKPKQCSMFFFSPFSRAKIDLPDFPINEIQHHASAFFDLPTSPHCIISIRTPNEVFVISKGQTTWTRCKVPETVSSLWPATTIMTCAGFDHKTQNFYYLDNWKHILKFSVKDCKVINHPVNDIHGREVHLSENCDDNDIFNMFTHEEQYTELLEPIPKPHQVP